ncbi:hypothetical protein [Cochlodiniinecator piscidefendens]|uniref:hypothetical protein n=1 Tax=Cochlodiniinecator piscidefendens TaxID=2715756 RepID=UPI001E296E49|nr:hypothetical protein [Cochlodiniinecator piscidefendens]
MMEAFSAMCEVHKRIDRLRAAETFSLKPRDAQTCREFLAHLEQHRWSGPELNEFEVGLALEIDMFFYGIIDHLPPAVAEEILAQ